MVDVHSDDPNEHLAADLEELLAEDERISEQGLQVTVRPGAVLVRGTVATRERRNAIVTAVAAQLPRHRIELDVTVLADEMHAPSGEEHLS
jgi:hypothetical protein